MWKKIKEILCKPTTSKDETTIDSITGTMTASVIDLRPSPTTSLSRTETLHHQPYYKLDGSNTLNKTNEHHRSLFNLLPTSLRPRHHHHHQTLNRKCVDASTTTKLSPSIDIIETDYMSQNFLNRTSSYTSCYSTIPTTKPISSISRYGSIENLLHGHSKSNPANINVLIRKNFQPFAQAHLAVTKGTIVNALFSRGPWLYVRIDSNGKTGYIPRIICSLYQNSMKTKDSSISSTDSSFIQETELDLTKLSLYPYKQPLINRYLSHSSAKINDSKQQQQQQQHIIQNQISQRETYTLPRPLSSRIKERRLTSNFTNQQKIESIIPTRDTDSSSTQDSGYSDSTPFFLLQQATPEKEQISLYTDIHSSKKSISTTSHYVSNQHSSYLKIPDSINPIQPHTFLNNLLMNDTTKRHSFGIFETTNHSKNISTNNNSIRRLPEFAFIRNVRQDKQKLKPSITNLPKSHIQIPASIFLNHHRQKQQFGSSHSAFRPVQPTHKHKRASSEGHSPPINSSSSSSSSNSVESLASSNSSLEMASNLSQRRRLSCDLPVPIMSKFNSNSLTRSVCDQSSPSKKINYFSRTMSDILCDQFSEINLDAIEKDSLIHYQPKKIPLSQHNLFTILKDYHSSRASFSVKRGDYVYVLKQVGRGCYLVRKHNNQQIGFLPKTLLIPATSTKVETFLEMHGYRETII